MLFVPFVVISIVVLNKSFNTFYNCTPINTTSDTGMCKIWEFTLTSAVFSAIVAALLASSPRMFTNYGNCSLYTVLITSCTLFLATTVWGFIEMALPRDSLCCLEGGLEDFQYVSLAFDIMSLSAGLIIFMVLLTCTTIFSYDQSEQLLYQAQI